MMLLLGQIQNQTVAQQQKINDLETDHQFTDNSPLPKSSKSSPVIQVTMDKHKGKIVSLQDLVTLCDNLEK
uniref:Uncharacterized protein n=1 Tax=Romanomermis culicivorax TaxID=13658 RepID=A0A915HGE7_ROMCU